MTREEIAASLAKLRAIGDGKFISDEGVDKHLARVDRATRSLDRLTRAMGHGGGLATRDGASLGYTQLLSGAAGNPSGDVNIRATFPTGPHKSEPVS